MNKIISGSNIKYIFAGKVHRHLSHTKRCQSFTVINKLKYSAKSSIADNALSIRQFRNVIFKLNLSTFENFRRITAYSQTKAAVSTSKMPSRVNIIAGNGLMVKIPLIILLLI
jgi:hypothetical protein